MDGIGNRPVGASMRSSMGDQKNTSATTTETTNASEQIPHRLLDERRIMPSVNQASNESESISHVAGVACTDESSGVCSSTPNRFAQLQLLSKKRYAKFFDQYKPSPEVVSATNAPHSEQRNFLCELRSAIECKNWQTFIEIISTLINTNTPNQDLVNLAKMTIQKTTYSGVTLKPIDTLDNLLSLFLRKKKTDLVEFFLELGANANFIDPTHKNSSNLTYACYNQNTEIACLLLKHGALVDGNRNKEIHSPLISAIKIGAFDCVKLLLAHRADVHYSCGLSPLCLAIQLNHHSIVELLLEHGAGVINSPGWMKNPLCYAAHLGDIAYVTLFLSKNYNVDGDQCKYSPLVCALQKDHFECARLLLSKGANPNGNKYGGRGPLRSIINNEYINTATGLSDINDNSADFSFRKIDIDLVRIMLHRGANPNDINFRSQSEHSLLLTAVFKNDIACVDLLLQYGAVGAHSDKISPLKASLKKRSLLMAMLLMLAGAKLDSSDTTTYNKLLCDNGYDHKPPLRLLSLCFQKVNSFVSRVAPQEKANTVTNLGLPYLLEKEFHNPDKLIFFQSQPCEHKCFSDST